MTNYQITPPVLLPVTLEKAKQALRVDADDTSMDVEITGFIVGETQELENTIGQGVMPQTWRAQAASFAALKLPHPVTSIIAITYLDQAGVSQALDADQVRIIKTRYTSMLVAAAGVTLPTTDGSANAVTIDVGIGMAATQDAVPPAIVLYLTQRLKQQFDPAARLEKDTVQANYTETLLDQFKVQL